MSSQTKECISKAAFAKVNLGIDCKGKVQCPVIDPRPASKSFPLVNKIPEEIIF